MSKIVYVTVPLPVILLLIMLIRVSFLEGADDGIRTYLWPSDDENNRWAPLKEKDIWVESIG